MSVKRFSCNGYWKDRQGYKRNGIALSGCQSFATAQAFLMAMKAYTNLALMRVVHNTAEMERVAGETPSTGHFDLGNYVARLRFYNYEAEDAGDSPNTTLVIPAPKDTLIEETKDGIWIVNETMGVTIAGLLATALGVSADNMEFIGGEVPEN